jgi:hypothetical protein
MVPVKEWPKRVSPYAVESKGMLHKLTCDGTVLETYMRRNAAVQLMEALDGAHALGFAQALSLMKEEEE